MDEPERPIGPPSDSLALQAAARDGRAMSSDAIEPPFISHQPDTPFGCPAGWGPRIAAHPDGRVHICNLDEGHGGRHRCTCGAERNMADA